LYSVDGVNVVGDGGGVAAHCAAATRESRPHMVHGDVSDDVTS